MLRTPTKNRRAGSTRGDGVRRVGPFQTNLASPRGHDTKWNPNWTVRIEGEVRLSAGRQNG